MSREPGEKRIACWVMSYGGEVPVSPVICYGPDPLPLMPHEDADDAKWIPGWVSYVPAATPKDEETG